MGSAVLMLASAGSLYVVLDHQLQAAIDQGLRQRVADIAADMRTGPIAVRAEELFAQVVAPDGRVLAASRGIAEDAPVLRPDEVQRARQHDVHIERDVRGLGNEARLLARPVRLPSGPVIIVAGTNREIEVEGQRKLAVALAVMAPLLIGAIAGGGWVLAGAALHPVGRMTEEADAVSLASVAEAGRRLAQPPGDDEIARLGRTLNAMLDRIEASFARERAFVDDASHELRTPLAILRGELELALAETHDPAAVERALRSGLEEAERLSRLADDLLVLARSQAGDIPLSVREVDLLDAARRVVARVAAGGGGVRVEVRGEAVAGLVDPDRLDQVLLNLLANARRFAGAVVVVSVRAVEGEAEVEVADDGPGFPAQLLPGVFDRFSRGDQARGREAGGGGAGLGLSIVAALVQAHHGTVEVMNGGVLGGAVVRVRVPAVGVRV
jgi:signal transduction histidine kinase